MSGQNTASYTIDFKQDSGIVSFLQFLFSAILNRDQAYQSVLDQGTILGLPWGTDIEGVVSWRRRRGGKGERKKKKGSPSDKTHSAEEGGEGTVEEE